MDAFNFSATSIKGFRACPHQWYLQRRVKLPRPQGAGASRGEKYHKELEDYLRDGKPVAPKSPLQAVLQYFPEPCNPNVYPEQLFERVPFLGSEFTVTGKIDVLYDRGIIDLKTGSDTRKYGLTEEQLIDDEQAILYAYWYFQVFRPSHTWVFTRLQYLPLDGGQPHKTEVVFKRNDVWEKCHELLPDLRKMRDLTAATAKREGNFCDAFGGCPYRLECMRGVAEKFDEGDNQ